MKKVLSVFLSTIIFILFIFPVSATNGEISIEQMKESIIGCGLPRNILNSMTDLQIEELYKKVETGESEIIIVKESALMDTEQNSTNTYALINEENFTLGVGAVVDYDDNDKIEKVVAFVIWQWVDAHPAGRRDDLVHISWKTSCFTFTTDNFISVDSYTKHLGEYVEYNKATSPAKATTRDMVVYTDVYSGVGVDRGGYCIFTLLPAKPMYRGNDYSTPIAATYYHNKSLVPYVNNFTFSDSSSGLSISFQDAFTDTLGKSFAFEYS